jgi:tetratricopeptide (TPR) repeat protein
MLAAGVFAGVYLSAAGLLCLANKETDSIAHNPVDMNTADAAWNHVALRTGEFYRTLAERLPYFQHDPKMIDRFFRLAIAKQPANYQAFASYAYYLVARNCCEDRLPGLLQETVRRCPTDARVHQLAAIYFLGAHQEERSYPFFRKALELDPNLARSLYMALEEHRQPVETMVSVTPGRTEALIQLAYYLESRKEQAKLQQVLSLLKERPLSGHDRLSLASLAFSAGLSALAKQQSDIAAKDAETRIDALKFAANMTYREGDWKEFARLAGLVEARYRSDGDMTGAADYAVSVAQMFHSRGKTAEAKQYLLQTINRYPRHAPAYSLLAALSQRDSPEALVYYLRKACELDENNVGYKMRLASVYLSQSKPQEAARLYSEMMQWPEHQEDAYLGLTDCAQMRSGLVQALVIVDQALARLGNTRRLLMRQASLYVAFTDNRKASRTLEQYISLYPEDSAGYQLLGDTSMKMGDFKKARANYELARIKDPQNAAAAKGLAELRLLESE